MFKRQTIVDCTDSWFYSLFDVGDKKAVPAPSSSSPGPILNGVKPSTPPTLDQNFSSAGVPASNFLAGLAKFLSRLGGGENGGDARESSPGVSCVI